MPRKPLLNISDLVTKYGEEMIHFWEGAPEQRLMVPCGTEKKTAERLRFKLYEVRNALRQLNSPLYPRIARVTLVLQHDAKNIWYVVAEPQQQILAGLLRNAGIVPSIIGRQDLPAEPPMTVPDIPDLTTSVFDIKNKK